MSAAMSAGAGVSTHILDVVRGEPANGVVVRLERAGPAQGSPGQGGQLGHGRAGEPEDWPGGPAAHRPPGEIGRAVTDADGRIGDFGTGVLEAGIYRLVFETGPYLESAHGGDGPGTAFFPEVVVTFAADGRRPRYHVPLLLGPYSYSTYRGS